jgi:site-specific recombinase XerD
MTVAPELVATTDLHELEDYGDAEIVRYMDISHAVDLWLGELERKGRARKTVDSYRRILDKLADQLPGVDIGEVTATQLRRFLDARALNAHKDRRGGKPKAPGTRAIEVTVLNNLFDWLTFEQVVKTNPTRRNGMRILARPNVGRPEDNDSIVSVTTNDVRALLEAARTWDEKITLHTLAYLGPRRHALAVARITDYDPDARTLTFREKGGKTIQKPVPDKLAEIIDGARAAGEYEHQDYLVPIRRAQTRRGERDDRVIYRIVKDVGARAGIDTHVHALRAAFAVYFLESGHDKYALQLLLGHSSPATTDVYLRRLDKRQRMETVRGLDWGSA